MSVTRTIDRLARVVRVEARRNPEFAARLNAAFAAHRGAAPDGIALDPPDEPGPATPSFNPVALLSREGADALRAALESEGLRGLQALAIEHNLDPAGEAQALGRAALVELLISQAQRRVERDKKLFDY